MAVQGNMASRAALERRLVAYLGRRLFVRGPVLRVPPAGHSSASRGVCAARWRPWSLTRSCRSMPGMRSSAFRDRSPRRPSAMRSARPRVARGSV